jgi:undecaprenyl-diphosphatase
MNTFDYYIMTYLNQFSQDSWALDRSISFLANSHLVKGLLVILIWWVWFKIDERQSHNREHLTITLLCCLFAIFVGKVLAFTLPFRFRPLHEASLHFLIPYGMYKTTLQGWSSFPSDTAVLYFALSTGLLFVSRKIGAFALLYTALFICLPRIYLGLHYPTDIITGAIIGIAIALLGNIYLFQSKSLKSITNWSLSKPQFFYTLFFIITYQIANSFDDVEQIISGVYKLFQSSLI